jgi:hypothetical protein
MLIPGRKRSHEAPFAKVAANVVCSSQSSSSPFCPLFFFLLFAHYLSVPRLLNNNDRDTHQQDYVRARLVQFAGAFAARACQQLGPADIRAAAAAAIARLPPPLLGGDGRGGSAGGLGGEGARELQLVFRHDCL